MSLALVSSSEEATRGIGRAIGDACAPGLTILLEGDLGAGKTVLVRGIGDALGAARVRSPSFALVNEYSTPSLHVVHADLYRLEGGEAEALGIEEHVGAPGTLFIVEWPDRWDRPPREEVLTVRIDALDEDRRLLTFAPVGEGAVRATDALREAAERGAIDGVALAGAKEDAHEG